MTGQPPSPDPRGKTVDPYTEYLDLPSGPRPPHLYGLLHIELFCSHPERIAQAVRKQFRRIKPYEDHPNLETRETIQDIMTQIATARVVLTDPEQKDAYDRTLAEELNIDRDEFLRNRLALPLPDSQLRITAGPNLVGERIDLVEGEPLTVGRDPQCTICLPSARVAKVHCQLERRDEYWVLKPADRNHPTLVNDHRCDEFLLADGDAIEAGGYRLRYVLLPEPVQPPPKLSPISLIVRSGPCVPAPVMNALPGETVLIGHCETALWQLPGTLVSRHHCRLQPVEDHWELQDLRSTNGVLVNGEQVTTATLCDHDLLSIGRFEIVVSFRL